MKTGDGTSKKMKRRGRIRAKRRGAVMATVAGVAGVIAFSGFAAIAQKQSVRANPSTGAAVAGFARNSDAQANISASAAITGLPQHQSLQVNADVDVAGTGLALEQSARTNAPAQTARAGQAATEAFTREDARAAIAASQAIATGGINELKTVEIGGIKQWISVRGNNPANPILLFLHGGPGSPMMPESWTFQKPWEDFFTVVQWDQRGTGKTFSAMNRQPDKSMTIEKMQADAEELIELLLRTYGKKKIFLMGHSWGSILGVKVAQHRPDLLYAYIGVGQVVNGERNEVVGYRETLAQAEKVGNQAAIQALEAMAPYPNPEGFTPMAKVLAERRWDVALGGMVYGQTKNDVSRIWALSPEYTDYDDASAGLGEISSVEILLPQMEKVNFDKVTTFQCPVFIFAGAEDRTTPESVAEKYYESIQAPEKRFFKIERAAHYVVTEAPGEVLMDLVEYVRPVGERQ
ncbi:MAG: alpha/beta hydrolase [Candidatus Acidiferrales bacterium]